MSASEGTGQISAGQISGVTIAEEGLWLSALLHFSVWLQMVRISLKTLSDRILSLGEPESLRRRQRSLIRRHTQ